jgi:hypothetical protein
MTPELEKHIKDQFLERDAEIARLRAENERLRAALEQYGRHEEGCEPEPWHGKGPALCSCGLAEALSIHERESK